MRHIQFILFLLFTTSFVLAEKPYWVFLTDDNLGPEVQLTARAEARLALRASPKTAASRAVSSEYIDQLKADGFKIRHVSRLLNAVSLETENTHQLQQLKQYAFVKSIRPVAGRVARVPDIVEVENTLSKATNIEYGPSLTQNDILNIPAIHDKGYTGSGVLIAVFDTGIKTYHSTFDNMDIVATYDFVDKETDPDYLNDTHGGYVLSILGGYSPGELIGPAFGASFILARTEDTGSETPAEEDNWVAALEWADSLGADIISSSLAYRDFDGTENDYPISALDGQTAIISQAANIAASRGILVVTSAGNEGPGPMTIWHPADSPHALSVGAITSNGSLSSFSSMGPTYDGRVKPDVVAMGTNVRFAAGTSSFSGGNGTSFSAPLISGLAALLLQVQPELKPDSVIALFRRNSDRAQSPDNSFGYGVPNLLNEFPDTQDLSQEQCLVFPNPSLGSQLSILLPDPVADLTESIKLFDIRGRFIAQLDIESRGSQITRVSLPTHFPLADQLYIVTVKAGKKIYAGKFVHLKY